MLNLPKEITMNTTRSLKPATLALLLSASCMAATFSAPVHAANPLNPTYFWGQATTQPFVGTGTHAAYVDAQNPLHPAHEFSSAGGWTGVENASGTAYADLRNPLYPAFKR
jgi:hypothetical protein